MLCRVGAVASIFWLLHFYLSDQFVIPGGYFIYHNGFLFSRRKLYESRWSNGRKKNLFLFREKKYKNRIAAKENQFKDTIEFNGVVNECLADTNFVVTIETGENVQCYISGKLRTNKVKIELGDLVKIQLHKLDVEKKKGRIILRYVNHNFQEKKKDRKRKKHYYYYKPYNAS